MEDCTYHIENMSIHSDGNSLKVNGYIRIDRDGHQVGMERVRLNSMDNEELIECLNELAIRLAEIS